MGREPDEALAAYYPTAYRRLVGALRVMGVPADDAVEVAQEAFVRLIPRWDQVSGYDRPDSWLRTVAWRVWLNRRRSGSRVQSVSEPPESTDAGASDHGQRHDTRLDLLAALAGLLDGDREVLVLHYLLDLSVARIADELGIAEGTVKSRLSRARARLSAALKTEEVDDV